MCGRYVVKGDREELWTRFDIEQGIRQAVMRFNVAPGQQLPVVVGSAPTRLEPMVWGLLPAWVTDRSAPRRPINARAETVADLPSFRQALKTGRCLVPASGFYEWAAATDRGPKVPHFFQRHDGGLFAFAGLYEVWRGRDGEEVRSYAIVTTAANEVVAPVHARMPVILAPEAEAQWRDPAITDPSVVLPLLQPYPGAAMIGYPVSRSVNNVRDGGPDLVRLA